jgi:hypothetical protein
VNICRISTFVAMRVESVSFVPHCLHPVINSFSPDSLTLTEATILLYHYCSAHIFEILYKNKNELYLQILPDSLAGDRIRRRQCHFIHQLFPFIFSYFSLSRIKCRFSPLTLLLSYVFYHLLRLLL